MVLATQNVVTSLFLRLPNTITCPCIHCYPVVLTLSQKGMLPWVATVPPVFMLGVCAAEPTNRVLVSGEA